ncbi:MAG TPA: GNAT family protein [Candidatus Dormibacteraeota bacterium]|nr:GNAT family protein [Candidatus Dormibacteraeota bacterium]
MAVRPLEADDFSQVWAASQRRGSRPGRVDSRAADRMRQRIRRSGRLTLGMLDLAIEVEGCLIGDIQARHPRNAMPSGVYELGIDIYDSRDHGKGYGTEAVRLLTGWLFEKAGAGRVQAGTAIANAGMRAVLERLGFSFEGVMRGFMAGPLGREDYALYGVTRADWENDVGRQLSAARPAGR